MANRFHYTGRLAAAPERREGPNGPVVRVTLIRNEYAGKDGDGNPRDRVVAIPVTAFGSKADAIYNNCRKGCQLGVQLRVENNRYTDAAGAERFDYNFVVDELEFGAPGEAKRSELASRPSRQTQD